MIKTCLYCDTVITHSNQRVCGDHRKYHNNVLYHRKKGKDYTNRVCRDCGTSIAHMLASCIRCVECRRLEKNRDQRERKARQYGPKPERNCENCGKRIDPSRQRTARFCNRKCLETHRTKNVDRSEYLNATKQRRLAYQRNWRKNNPARTSSHKAKRRANELVGKFTESDWKRLVNYYRGRCAYCGNESVLTVDHVVPLSRGGTNYIGNLLPACQSCNSSKHNLFLVEWRFKRNTRGGGAHALETAISGRI